MIFLSPLWLALSAAALVPLLLHLRRRPQGRVVEFPAARYLARATHDHERSLRARNSLLALLRTLLVLLLALAAAGPLARVGKGHGRAAVAVLLDNSLSTSAVANGRRVLDEEKVAARAIFSAATLDDRLWLVTADAHSISGDPAMLGAVLDTLAPLAGAGDIAGAVRTASARTSGVIGATPVLTIITDGQATSWRAPAGAAPQVVWTPRGAPPPNRAIVGAEPRPARWSGAGVVHVTARSTAADSLPIRIEVAGRTLGRGSTLPNAERVAETDITVADAPRGWSAGRAVLAPDELTADDERWFATWSAPAPRVTSHGGAFVDRAVDALGSAGVVAPGADVNIAMADAVTDRPVLVVAPLDPSRIGASNRALERAGIPWRLGAERRERTRVRGAGFNITDVRRRYALTAATLTAAETLATAGAEPWIVAGDGYVLVASALDTAATTLPATAEFVPWLARMLTERLAGTGRPATPLVPGAAVAVPPGVDGIETPDGDTRAAGDSLARPERAGVYFWTRDRVRVGAVTVNAEVEESVLERLGDQDMRRLLRPAMLTHDAEEFAREAYREASRRPLGSALLAAALVVLLVETAVAAMPGAARRGAAAAAGSR